MKVALVHDWLIHMRGGEKVLEAMAELFPDATIYTLFCRAKNLSPALARMKIKTSFLQWLPGICLYYRWLLPILPWVISTLKLDAVDLVISSSHCVAKGIRLPDKAYHVCYCHTPMRYLWGFENAYFKPFPFWVRPILNCLLARLRRWDLKNNSTVHQFIANSENVRKRIRDFYGREALVIYPPVDTHRFKPTGKVRDYYLVVSAFVPYKRIDLVIEAFNSLPRKLLIVGSGPLERTYRRLRKNSQILFLGAVSSSKLHLLYSEARALIFPTEEDFGIVPVEAQACGTPVLAYRKGGAQESVKAGLFFDEQTPEAIRTAVYEFEKMSFDRSQIPGMVTVFNRGRFKEELLRVLEQSKRQTTVTPAAVDR